MSTLRVLHVCCLAIAAAFIAPATLAAEAGKKDGARVLMVTQSAGFRHGSVTRPDGKLAPAERAMTDLGISSNLFRVECTQDVKEITKDRLDASDMVLFYTTGDLPFADDVRDYLFNVWVKQPRPRLYRHAFGCGYLSQLPAVLGNAWGHV